jgi:hypothetical protein
MDETIQLLGKKDRKATQKLIDENEVINTDSVSYLSVNNQPIEIRKTLDGRPLVELDEPMALIVNTKFHINGFYKIQKQVKFTEEQLKPKSVNNGKKL